MSLNAMSLCFPVADALQTVLTLSPAHDVKGTLTRKIRLGLRASLQIDTRVRGFSDVEKGYCTIHADILESLSMVLRFDHRLEKQTLWLYDNCKHRFTSDMLSTVQNGVKNFPGSWGKER